jgi:hypothetical protein
VLRQILSGLSHHSKKQVYQTIIRNYPLVISDRFAKAAIKYASDAVLAISKGPRVKGLIIGTVVAAALYAGYYFSPAQSFNAAKMSALGYGRYAFGAELLVWLVGYIIAWLTIRYMAAGALQKLLPSEALDKSDTGLPTAGEQGTHAMGTTMVAWLLCAFFAFQKPAWVLTLLKMVGKTAAAP